MRWCSRFWICCWLLKLSLGMGMGLNTLAAASSASAATHTAHLSAAAPPLQLAADTSTMASHDECHGHAMAQTQASQDDTVHCGDHADCHHCCPLCWGHGLGMAFHAAPNVHPTRHVDDWPSASWLPDLRPPIA